ncbi:hypothetical protein J6590_103367, partial [Homalodisca vitripennis]
KDTYAEKVVRGQDSDSDGWNSIGKKGKQIRNRPNFKPKSIVIGSNVKKSGSKTTELEVLCDSNELDNLSVVEHWMTRDELLYYSSLSDLDLSAYFCRQTPRDGAAVYVRNSLKCTPLDLERYSEVQQTEFAGTIVNEVSLVDLAMYRSPLGCLVTLGFSVVIKCDHNINLCLNLDDAQDFKSAT